MNNKFCAFIVMTVAGICGLILTLYTVVDGLIVPAFPHSMTYLPLVQFVGFGIFIYIILLPMQINIMSVMAPLYDKADPRLARFAWSYVTIWVVAALFLSLINIFLSGFLFSN